MTVGHVDDLAATAVTGHEARDVTKRVALGPADGWEGWVMRVFEIAPGGHTPHHVHAWPHINVVLEGEGVLRLDDGDRALRAGSYAFVAPGARHQYRAAAHEALRLVCIVPEEGDA
jgi:quercetin dioxygenase-like cupin family protein